VGRCASTTVYLSGVQVRLADITAAHLDGSPIPVETLHRPEHSGQLEIVTPYGTTTVTLDRHRLHGRPARAGRAGSVAGDPVLAALALRNLAAHVERGESLGAARRQCTSALACVESETLEAVAREFPAAIPAWAALASAQLAVRLLRQPGLAELARTRGQLDLYPELATLLDTETKTASIDTGSALWRFTTEVAAGGRPDARSYMQRAALAATHPDLAQEMLSDPHPLVRAAAYRHATREQLIDALASETATVARRCAAAALAEQLGVTLIDEGPIAGRQAGIDHARPDIVFVDVDGTLIEGPAVRDEWSLAALAAARAAGVQVVLVTGRTLDELVPLQLGFDLVVADGTFVDLATGRVLASGDGTRKDLTVDTVCTLLGTDRCAAVGDGAVDAAMFTAVRARGGRAAALVSGQDDAIAAATDLVGPFGSGGVGRFVERLTTGVPSAQVPGVEVAGGRTTNYTSWQIDRRRFADVVATAGVPDGWQIAHGHVTFAYPTGDAPGPLPDADPAARLEAYALTRTDKVVALAVRAVRPDGQTLAHQHEGGPLHLTLATGPSSRGGFIPPAAAGRAVADAVADGTLEPLEPPLVLPALAAPAGTPERRLPDRVEAAAIAQASSGGPRRDAAFWHRIARTGGETIAEHASAPNPLAAALRDSSPLTTGLLILSGVPAAGKTTFAREAARHGAAVVSLDTIRGELNGDERSQERLGDVLALARARTATELSLGRVVVSDATNVEARVIEEQVRAAQLAGVAAIGVHLQVEATEALQRDRERHRQGLRAVGTSASGHWDEGQARRIIERMAARWEKTGGSAGAEAAGLDAVLSPAETLSALRRRRQRC
jgi:predicted kinase